MAECCPDKSDLTVIAAHDCGVRSNWAIPFNKGTPPMDDFSVSVPGVLTC